MNNINGAYVELLPPDRPIFMVGQPIIRLIADGGPGAEFGAYGMGDMSGGNNGMGCCGKGDEPEEVNNGTYISMSDLACCGIGCADSPAADMSGYSLSRRNRPSPESVAVALQGRCVGLEAQIGEIVAFMDRLKNDRSLSQRERANVLLKAQGRIRVLRASFKRCLSGLARVVKSNRVRFIKRGMPITTVIKIEAKDKLNRMMS